MVELLLAVTREICRVEKYLIAVYIHKLPFFFRYDIAANFPHLTAINLDRLDDHSGPFLHSVDILMLLLDDVCIMNILHTIILCPIFYRNML